MTVHKVRLAKMSTHKDGLSVFGDVGKGICSEALTSAKLDEPGSGYCENLNPICAAFRRLQWKVTVSPVRLEREESGYYVRTKKREVYPIKYVDFIAESIWYVHMKRRGELYC